MHFLWNNINVIFIAITALTTRVGSDRIKRQTSTSNCATADGNLGRCIEIRSCKVLYDLALNQNQNRNVVELLRKAQCGFEGRFPKVCCALESTTDFPTPPTVNPTFASPPTIRVIPTSAPSPPPVTMGQMISPAVPLISGSEDYSKCGRNNLNRPRIVAGQPAELGAWPWMAAIGYRTTTRPGPDFRCGGTLITNRHVITAAHCVSNIGSWIVSVVRLGDLNLDDSVADKATPVDKPVAKVTPHSRYVPKPVENDIAIITLQDPVQFTRLIRPICLPNTPQLRSELFEKRMPFIMGWGATAWRAPSSNLLLEAQVPVVDNPKCKQNYINERNAIIDERVLCAGDGTKDSCQGDSGGPLIQPNGTTYYLIGVVSYGIRCAEANFPGVYTRITQFLDWIEQNTQ